MMAEVDHCTGWFEGWWAHCCAAHDVVYGTAAELADKIKGDFDLWGCVASTGPVGAVIGTAMFGAVSTFGLYFWRKARKDKR